MNVDESGHRILELLVLPFMQRALEVGILTGILGGLLGSFSILRQLSFFSDALGHSALLGLVVGLLLGQDPKWILLPFAVVFGLVVNGLLRWVNLPTDALLNIVYSGSLALAIIGLTFTDAYRGRLTQLLFGDILGTTQIDLWITGSLLLLSGIYLGLTLRIQMLITLHEPLALAQGVSKGWHHWIFVVVLSLAVAVSIQSVGILLVSAFIVIPACTAQVLSRRFTGYVLLAMSIGGISAVIGVVGSAVFNLPSGPSIVTTQLILFLTAILVSAISQRIKP